MGSKIVVFEPSTLGVDFLEVATLLGAHRAIRKPVAITDLLYAVQRELQEGADPNGHGPQGAKVSFVNEDLQNEVR